jgi:type IV pilus assembly protein PilO
MKIGLREVTFFVLLLGILGLAGYFVFLPHYRQTQQTMEENRVKQARLAQLERLGQTSDSLTKELAELGKALEFFESKLPNDQQIHNVLREVTQNTEKHGLATKSVRTLKQIESNDYVALPIEMDLAGPFEGLYQFLLELERMPRITKISQMEVNKDASGEGMVTTKLVVSVYFDPANRSGDKKSDSRKKAEGPSPRAEGRGARAGAADGVTLAN